MMKRDWDEVFFEAMVTGDTSRAIENQEKRGQQDLVHSETLPKEHLYCTREQFETLGVLYGDDVDDLFVRVTLPAGWKKVATGHSMWSDLVDDKGRKRAGIFYKAAFYDRKAHININRRYSFSYQPVNGWDAPTYSDDDTMGVVTDQAIVIWKTEGTAKRGEYKEQDALVKEAKAWLAEHYPDYENPLAYWD